MVNPEEFQLRLVELGFWTEEELVDSGLAARIRDEAGIPRLFFDLEAMQYAFQRMSLIEVELRLRAPSEISTSPKFYLD